MAQQNPYLDLKKATARPYQICVRCIMDTTDPTITFDDRGFCNHCTRVETDFIGKTWQPEANDKLMARIAEIKEAGKDQKYDCLIGLSGGVDSSFLAHLVVREWGLRPLAVHVDAGWNSAIAVHNIEVLVRGLDIDLYTEVIDWENVQDLQRAYMLSGVENQDVPQDHVFFSVLNRLVIKYDLKYFLTGGNASTESILPSSWGYDATDSVNLLDIHRRFGSSELDKYPYMSLWKRHIYYRFIAKFEAVRLLDLYPYFREPAIKTIESLYGWKNYGDKHHESRWTRWFQAHYLPYKFGIDKRRAHIASMVMSGELTRDAALEAIKQPLYDPSQLLIDTEYVKKKLGFSDNEYLSIMNAEPKIYSEYKNAKIIMDRMRRVKRMFRL